MSSPGLVYLVQPPEYHATNRYKIGMSSSCSIHRIRSYGYECAVYMVRACSNPEHVEQELISEFTKVFGRAFRGREWFEGDITSMIQVMTECVDKHAELKVETVDQIDTPDFASIFNSFIYSHIEALKNMEPLREDDIKYTTLLDILPDEWFNQPELQKRLACNVRSIEPTDIGQPRRIIRHLMMERCAYFSESLIVHLFSKKHTYNKRFSLRPIVRMIKCSYPKRYEKWSKRRFLIPCLCIIPRKKKTPKKKGKKKGEGLVIEYDEGSVMRLSTISEMTGQRHTRNSLSKIDARFVVSTMSACKSCGERHLKGCCDEYKRTNCKSVCYVTNVRCGPKYEE